MFLLLWLQTIPSQTALSGANPISRRIAELSGCVGVCAHGRTAGSQWEQTTLPTALLFSPALQGPRRQSQASAGPNSLSETISLFTLPVPGACESRAATHCRSAERGMAAHQEEGRNPAGLGCLQPFLVFPRHSSPRAHTKFLRGWRPKSPQNQN